jgi:hypothetical protein
MGIDDAAMSCPESIPVGKVYAPRKAESGALCVAVGYSLCGGYERKTTLAKRNAELEVKERDRGKKRQVRNNVTSSLYSVAYRNGSCVKKVLVIGV